MELKRFSKQWERILFPAICLLLSGCGSFFPEYSAPPSTSSGTIIHSGAQASFRCEDVIFSIASSNYKVEEFIDEFGAKRKETVAGLHFVIQGKPETRRYYSAYAGLSIYYYSYKIIVLRTGIDRNNQFAEVEVFGAEQAGKRGSCSPY